MLSMVYSATVCRQVERIVFDEKGVATGAEDGRRPTHEVPHRPCNIVRFGRSLTRQIQLPSLSLSRLAIAAVCSCAVQICIKLSGQKDRLLWWAFH